MTFNISKTKVYDIKVRCNQCKPNQIVDLDETNIDIANHGDILF